MLSPPFLGYVFVLTRNSWNSFSFPPQPNKSPHRRYMQYDQSLSCSYFFSMRLHWLAYFYFLSGGRGTKNSWKRKKNKQATTIWNVIAMHLLAQTSTVQYIRVQSEVGEINPELKRGNWFLISVGVSERLDEIIPESYVLCHDLFICAAVPLFSITPYPHLTSPNLHPIQTRQSINPKSRKNDPQPSPRGTPSKP